MRLALLFATLLPLAASAQDTLYASPDFAENGAYVVYPDRVVQHRLDGSTLEARVTGPAEIHSEYAAAYRPRLPASTIFKFSLNQRDNERPPFQDHVLPLRAGASPTYVFGEPDPASVAAMLEAEPVQNAGETVEVEIRADLRHVLRAFEVDGFVVGTDGERIEAADFEGVYVAGSHAPLSWNWGALGESARLHDEDGDGIYAGTFAFESAPGARSLSASGSEAIWRLRPGTDLSAYPTFTSSVPLLEALWSLSLEELQQNVREDGALMAGAKWPGVWTRDVSYAALLSLGILDPDAVKRSLLAKLDTLRLDDGSEIVRVLQDTGTGGSWPVSTDRSTWALAASELYNVTGDTAWRRTAYEALRNTAEVDRALVFDEDAGLFRGEQSFLDWREQSYPAWMTPVDIAQSQALGTNVAHSVLSDALLYFENELKGEATSREGAFDEPGLGRRLMEGASRRTWLNHKRSAIREAFRTQLWDSEAGTYYAYRYGREHMALAERSETLGASLAVLYRLAQPEEAQRIVAETPVAAYGAPSFYPQIIGVPPYHNDGVWPFVNAFWTWAAARVGNEAAVTHGMSAHLRAAALFLTNKENFVATTGHFEGTEVNSDRQLWSVAGTLALPLRVLLGMGYGTEQLSFKPFVPQTYGGVHALDGLRWRDATLRVEVRGSGTRVASAMLGDEQIAGLGATYVFLKWRPEFAGTHQTLVIQMDSLSHEPSSVNLVPNAYAPATPVTSGVGPGGSITWSAVEDAAAYEVWIDGKRAATTAHTAFAVPASPARREVQVRALGTNGHRSFLSEPMPTVPYGGAPIAPITLGEADTALPADVPAPGRYALRIRFENRAGPVNTGSLADVRIVTVNGAERGAVVFPQLGPEGSGFPPQWSAPIPLDLAPGDRIGLRFDAARTNMRGEAVPVRLLALDLTRISD